MDWKTPKLSLQLNTPKRHKKISSVKWSKMRSDTLRKANGYCDFCGGCYDKLICAVYKFPHLSACCKLCFSIQHMTIPDSYQFELLRTNLSYLEIIRRFVNYYKKYDKSPRIEEIDPDATVIPLSLTEFLKAPFKTDLKAFPNEYFDTGYLEKDNQISLIIEEDSSDILSESDTILEKIDTQESIQYYIKLQKNDPCKNIRYSRLRKDEITHLKSIFYPKRDLFKNKLKSLIKDTRKIDFDLQETDMKYNLLKNLVSFL